MICEKCASGNIKHYKQLRRDGVWVVCARCENGHNPVKSRPFYPVSEFDLASLPILGAAPTGVQPELIPYPVEEPYRPATLLDYVEWKRNLR